MLFIAMSATTTGIVDHFIVPGLHVKVDNSLTQALSVEEGLVLDGLLIKQTDFSTLSIVQVFKLNRD